MAEKKNYEESNPIVLRVGNIDVRETNFVKIKYNAYEYARLLKISQQTGIPVSKIIALSSQQCPICGNDHVAITLPLSLISSKKQNAGKSAHKYHKNDDKQG